MRMFELSAPSKTFLIGEYAVMQAGSAVVLATEPRFHLRAEAAQVLDNSLFHPESPAGKFYNSHLKLHSLQISFEDPHRGQGGFGASSAQFILLYQLNALLENRPPLRDDQDDLGEILQAYHQASRTTAGIQPSGADVATQLLGQMTCYNKAQQHAAATPWPFTDLGFVILRTGNKIATHEHLATLNTLDTTHLQALTEHAITALQTTNSDRLLATIDEYANALQALDLTCQTSLDLLTNIKAQPACLAAKACGALGADVIIVFTTKVKQATFLHWCQQQQLDCVATDNQLTTGLTTIRSINHVVC